MSILLKILAAIALLTAHSVANADEKQLLIVKGGLVGEEFELQSLKKLSMVLKLDSDLQGFSGSAKYSGGMNSWTIGHFGIPVNFSNQCVSKGCRSKVAHENILLRVGWFTFHCDIDDEQKDGLEQKCKFAVPLVLTKFADLTLTWNSALYADLSAKNALLDFSILPVGRWPNTFESIEFQYDLLPEHPSIFVGSAPDLKISLSDFIMNWGDPNRPFSRSWTSVPATEIPPFKLWVTEAEKVKAELEARHLVANSGATEIPRAQSKPAQKLVFDQWPVSNPRKPFADFPIPDSVEEPKEACPPLPMIKGTSALQDVLDDPTLHARSENLIDQCFGRCPSSYYVSLPNSAKPSADSEVHFVGVYRGTEKSVRVRVLATAKPVVLVLSSYEPVKWNILAGPEAKLITIYLTGYDGGRSEISGAGSAKIIHLPGKNYADDWEKGRVVEKVEFQRTMRSIRGAIKMKETSFQGTSNGADFIVPYYVSADFMKAREQEALKPYLNTERFVPEARIVTLTNGRFILSDLRTRAVQPLDLPVVSEFFSPTLFDITSTTGEVFVALKNGLLNVNKGETFPAPVSVPPFNYLSAVAYDSKRERFIIVGRNSVFDRKARQYFYAFYPKDKTWKILASHDEDFIKSMAYDPEKDVFYALSPAIRTLKNETLLWTINPDLTLKSAIFVQKLKIENQSPTKLFWTHDGLVVQSFRGPLRSETNGATSTIDPCSGMQWSIIE